MTPSEMIRARDIVVAAWPRAQQWPAATWDIWWEELHAYPASLVEYVLRGATSREHPPSAYDVARVCAEQARKVAYQRTLRAGIDQW